MAHQSPGNLQPVQTLARHGKSFYWASLFLGSKLANRAAQLYQFCRYVDDLADGDLPDRHESLDNIRGRLIGSDVLRLSPFSRSRRAVIFPLALRWSC
jgi:phytoene/squalene synthetase